MFKLGEDLFDGIEVGRIFRRWKEPTGTAIIDGLGSTENLHIFIASRREDIKPGTSGKPVSGYEVKLVDEDDVDITEPDMIGTVWVKGESAATLYWNNAEKTANHLILQNNWSTLGPILQGKLHIIAGELDTFYLEGPVRALKESLQRLGSDAVIEIVPGADHSSFATPDLRKRIDEQLLALFGQHHGLPATRAESQTPTTVPAH